jgi:hypothetical protein
LFAFQHVALEMGLDLMAYLVLRFDPMIQACVEQAIKR